jgi:hypothetical protein
MLEKQLLISAFHGQEGRRQRWPRMLSRSLFHNLWTTLISVLITMAVLGVGLSDRSTGSKWMYPNSSFKHKSFLKLWYTTMQWIGNCTLLLSVVKALSHSWPARTERWHIRSCLWLNTRHLSHIGAGAVTLAVIPMQGMQSPRALVQRKGFTSSKL